MEGGRREILVKTGVDLALDPDIAEVYFNSVAQREESEERVAGMVSGS